MPISVKISRISLLIGLHQLNKSTFLYLSEQLYFFVAVASRVHVNPVYTTLKTTRVRQLICMVYYPLPYLLSGHSYHMEVNSLAEDMLTQIHLSQIHLLDDQDTSGTPQSTLGILSTPRPVVHDNRLTYPLADKLEVRQHPVIQELPSTIAMKFIYVRTNK